MAKKTVASIQKGEGRTYSKVIIMEKSPKTGAYVFKEETKVLTDYFHETILNELKDSMFEDYICFVTHNKEEIFLLKLNLQFFLNPLSSI